MHHPVLSDEEICRRGQELYEGGIRQQVETQENIGKIASIDVETGDYEVDETGIASSHRLQAKHSGAAICAVRIGYNAVFSLGGALTRTTKT